MSEAPVSEKTKTLNNGDFIKNNLRLVHALANRFRNRGIEYEELYSAGCVGLVKAAKGFDDSRGLMFSTYAVPIILGEIKRLFRDGGAIKVSRGLKELSLKVTRARDILEQRNSGEPVKISDIAGYLSVSPEEVSEALGVSLPPISLTDYDDGSERDLPSEAPQVKQTELIALQQILINLNANDRRLIIMRYWQNKTQIEIGKVLGMSQVQVSRRERKILLELKKQLE